MSGFGDYDSPWDGMDYEPASNIGPTKPAQTQQPKETQPAQKDSYEVAKAKNGKEPFKPAPPKGR